MVISKRLSAAKEALVQSSQPNGALEPLLQLLNLSQLQGILLAYLPESPLGHRLRTHIYAVDMFGTLLNLMSEMGKVAVGRKHGNG